MTVKEDKLKGYLLAVLKQFSGTELKRIFILKTALKFLPGNAYQPVALILSTCAVCRVAWHWRAAKGGACGHWRGQQRGAGALDL